jgi:hypothetical protein
MTGRPTMADDHYEVEVNRGDLSTGSLTRDLNKRHAQGWKLAHIFEQAGNTVMVFEKVK